MSNGKAVDERLSAARSGVYRAADASPQTPAAAAGFDVVTISLSGAADKNALLERFAAALAFPDWFGGNWDALEDCLGDLSWREDRGHLLLIEDVESLASTSRDDFHILLDLLGDVAQLWSVQGRAFFAVFVDPRRRLELQTWGDASA